MKTIQILHRTGISHILLKIRRQAGQIHTMKAKQLIHLALLLITHTVLAQNHDYNWVLGYSSNPNNPEFGGTNINFGKTPAEVKYVYRDIDISFNTTSISDSTGNLLCYTNACVVAGADDQVLENGDGINPGPIHDSHCSDDGYPMTQGSVMIPDPNGNNQYYYFHKPVITIRRPLLDAVCIPFYYSKIDMEANNGAGKVIEKNVPFLQDTIIWSELTAVKHANGRDWWIVTPKYPEAAYVVVLVDTAGVHVQDYQYIGFETPREGVGSSNAVFSPDGKTYARFNSETQLFLFDFDRATGLLSNFRNIQVKPPEESGASGLAFSPDSKLLYFSMHLHVYQYDLEATDIAASQMIVAEYDGFVDIWQTRFNKATLGPDCRIYIISTGTTKFMHVIEHPNIRGLACEVNQHSFELATRMSRSLPFHPNYRLGPTGHEGYPCDSTLVATVQPIVHIPEVNVYPNPVYDQLQIDLISRSGIFDFALYSVSGQRVLFQSGIRHSGSIDVSTLATGMYFWTVSHAGNILQSGKVVKQY